VRVLVLGGNGQLGHRVWMAAMARSHDTWVTLRHPAPEASWGVLFPRDRVVEGVEASHPASLDAALALTSPDIVINALGIVKQRADGSDVGRCFAANVFVPHYLAQRCAAAGIRFITVSSDCVFTGQRGFYAEGDQADALDVYGMSKRLGEIDRPHLTLRTSHIGRSLSGQFGLLEWLLAQTDSVPGYRRAIYSGLTTAALAATIMEVIDHHPSLAGLWHVSSRPITKLDLLVTIRDAFGLETEIIPVDEPVIDRSLDDRRFRTETGIPQPTWAAMIGDLATDPTPYATLRGERP